MAGHMGMALWLSLADTEVGSISIFIDPPRFSDFVWYGFFLTGLIIWFVKFRRRR